MCCTAISVPNLQLKTTACALHYTLVWGKWAILPLPPLVTMLLTAHQSGSCSLDPGWHIHRQSEPGLAGTCILQSRASPGTTLLRADGTAANGREEYKPRCKRMNKEHKEICSETFQWQNVLKARYWSTAEDEGRYFTNKSNRKVISWILRLIIYFSSILKKISPYIENTAVLSFSQHVFPPNFQWRPEAKLLKLEAAYYIWQFEWLWLETTKTNKQTVRSIYI